jgi:predicted ATPase
LPSSIRGIVAARLDALPGPERAVLLDASVVGKVFWRGVLERLRPDREDLSGLLGSLERRDLIRREASSQIKGDHQFSFKHGLIREVAYLTLPREERRRCHHTTAEFLEDVSLGAGDSDASLAYHWREGGQQEHALRYLIAAAEFAGRGWAKARAASLYTQALELVPEADAALRREITMKRAVAAAAVMHATDVEHSRGRERGAGPPS